MDAERFEVQLNDPGAFRAVVSDLLRASVIQAQTSPALGRLSLAYCSGVSLR
jgi:hypothetical protein